MKSLAKEIISNKSAKKSRKKFSFKKFGSNILTTLCLCALIFGILYLSTFIIALPMRWILGSEVTKPVWTFVYQALTYILTLVILLSIPKICQIFRKSRFGQKFAKTKFARTKFYRFLAKDSLDLTTKNTRDNLGLTGLPTWTDLGLAPIGYIVSLLIGYALVALFSFFPWFNATETQELGYATTILGFDRILAFIALCVLAPFAEELIFRGWLYGKQRKKSGAVLAILLNAIFFGFMHGQWNVALSVGAIGAVACALREITGTAYAGILLHMIKNSVAFILLFVYGL